MKTFLLNSGLELLQDQSNDIIEKIVFTGFEIGSGIGEVVDRDSTAVAGQLLHTGGIESMFITPIHTDEVLISCEIGKEVLEFRPGNILLRANDGIAFLISISQSSMFKFQTTLTSVGTKLIFNTIINIPGLIDRFDLSNLSQKVATFKTFATDLDVTRWAWEEPVNQLFVENDGRLNTPAIVISSGRNYWSNPFIKKYDELYETWATRYPWLEVLPIGKSPNRQADYSINNFWMGWPKLNTTNKQTYFDEVGGYEDIEGNTLYDVQCSCGAIIITATASIGSFDMEVLWQMDYGSESNSMKIIRDPDDKHIKFLITLDDILVKEVSVGYVADGVMFKIGMSWFQSVIRGSLNGSPAISINDAPFTVFVIEREGTTANLQNKWLGVKHSYARFSDELSNEVLQLMSVIN